MSEIIFCLGSHIRCNIGKTGKSWGWGGRKGLWPSHLQSPPGRGGKMGPFRGAATRLCYQRHYNVQLLSQVLQQLNLFDFLSCLEIKTNRDLTRTQPYIRDFIHSVMEAPEQLAVFSPKGKNRIHRGSIFGSFPLYFCFSWPALIALPWFCARCVTPERYNKDAAQRPCLENCELLKMSSTA